MSSKDGSHKTYGVTPQSKYPQYPPHRQYPHPDRTMLSERAQSSIRPEYALGPPHRNSVTPTSSVPRPPHPPPPCQPMPMRGPGDSHGSVMAPPMPIRYPLPPPPHPHHLMAMHGQHGYRPPPHHQRQRVHRPSSSQKARDQYTSSPNSTPSTKPSPAESEAIVTPATSSVKPPTFSSRPPRWTDNEVSDLVRRGNHSMIEVFLGRQKFNDVLFCTNAKTNTRTSILNESSSNCILISKERVTQNNRIRQRLKAFVS